MRPSLAHFGGGLSLSVSVSIFLSFAASRAAANCRIKEVLRNQGRVIRIFIRALVPAMPPEAAIVAVFQLPAELLSCCALTLDVKAVLSWASTSSVIRGAVLASTELWASLAANWLGPFVLQVQRLMHPQIPKGIDLFREAVRMRRALFASLDVEGGSVVNVVAALNKGNGSPQVEVVACPCLPTLVNYSIGAQGAIRRAAGSPLEDAIRGLERPVDMLSVTLLPGGELAPCVALTVTSMVPWDHSGWVSFPAGHLPILCGFPAAQLLMPCGLLLSY